MASSLWNPKNLLVRWVPRELACFEPFYVDDIKRFVGAENLIGIRGVRGGRIAADSRRSGRWCRGWLYGRRDVAWLAVCINRRRRIRRVWMKAGGRNIRWGAGH